MAKFAAKHARPQVRTPIVTTGVTTTTYEGGEGYDRDPKSELFLLAVANMVGEDTFYEGSGERDSRFRDLVHRVTLDDPDWVRRFVGYLRGPMRMRSASVVMAAEYVAAGGPEGRAVISSALQRPDEPAEMLAYWITRYGRAIPKPVKRGVADAATRLYNERAALKYDGTDRPFRMGDVIDLVHPKPKAPWQNSLFLYLLDVRHRRAEPRGMLDLGMIAKNKAARAILQHHGEVRLTPDELAEAGMTWETLSSFGAMDAERWNSVIPSMGQMALVRNLRNFDEAGISQAAMTTVVDKLRDPEEVKRSRQLPIRYFTAWKQVRSLRWGDALERALQHSLANVPELTGRTLVLVDCSGSMNSPLSARSTISMHEAAAVFGTALALRCEKADLVAYGTGYKIVGFRPQDSVLRIVEQSFHDMGGTETWQTVQATYQGHDRVVIVTDEQAFAVTQQTWGRYEPVSIPEMVKAIPVIHTFNLNGYRAGHAPSGSDGRYTYGGLSDAAFEMLPLVEAGRSQDWPF